MFYSHGHTLEYGNNALATNKKFGKLGSGVSIPRIGQYPGRKYSRAVFVTSILKKANDGRSSRLGSTLHVQVKSWRGTRGGGNGCHCCAVCARATVLAVCCVSVAAVSAVIMAVTAQPAFRNGPTSKFQYKPSSTPNHHPHRTIIYDQSYITSSVVTKTSIFLPPSCYLLGADCLSGARSPLLLRKRGWLGVPSAVVTGSGKK